MGDINTQPQTSSREFMARLVEASDNLSAAARTVTDDDLMRLISKRQAVETAIDLWDNIAKAGGWAPGKTLADAYTAFEQAIKRNKEYDKDSAGSVQGYGLVLDYLRSVGY